MSRLKLSWDSGFSSKIGTIPPNSGRLDTLQGFFYGEGGGGGGGVRGHASPKKIRNLRSSTCWKCTDIVNLTITLLFLYHLKYFTIPSGGPFWLLGGGGACAPRAPPCLRACYSIKASPNHPSYPSTFHTDTNTVSFHEPYLFGTISFKNLLTLGSNLCVRGESYRRMFNDLTLSAPNSLYQHPPFTK